MPISISAAAGLGSTRQDFPAFVTRAHATKSILTRVLIMLSALQPQSLSPITISRNLPDKAQLCYAADALASTSVSDGVNGTEGKALQQTVGQITQGPLQVRRHCLSSQADLTLVLCSPMISKFGSPELTSAHAGVTAPNSLATSDANCLGTSPKFCCG